MYKTRLSLLIGLAASAACTAGQGGAKVEQLTTAPPLPTPVQLCDYPQAFGNPAHTGIACAEQVGLRVVTSVVQDPDAPAENAASGFLQIHEGAPLTSGDFVVIPSKKGFTNRFARNTESYSVLSRWQTGRQRDTATPGRWLAAVDGWPLGLRRARPRWPDLCQLRRPCGRSGGRRDRSAKPGASGHDRCAQSKRGGEVHARDGDRAATAADQLNYRLST